MMRTLCCFLFLLMSVMGNTDDDIQCYSQHTTRTYFTASSARNDSTHRIVSVKTRNGAHWTLPSNVSVDHWTSLCDDIETVELSVHMVIPVKAPIVVPSDYVLVPGMGFYKMNRRRLTWPDALKECQKHNASLAVPDTQTELYLLKKFKQQKELGDWIWVGMHRINGSWITAHDNKTARSNIGWARGEPDNAGDCSRMWDTGVYAQKCILKGASICEKPVKEESISFKKEYRLF